MDSLNDFFTIIGDGKQKVEKERKDLIGEIKLEGLFASLETAKKKDEKDQETLRKEVAAFKEFLFSEPEKEEPVVEVLEEVSEPEPEPEQETEVEEEEVPETEPTEIVESEEVTEEVVDENIENSIKILDKIIKEKVEEVDPRDAKISKMEREMDQLRKMVHESIRIASTNSGGGEVWFKYLDDVSVSNVADGDTLVWDSTLSKWIPSSASGGSSDTLSNDLEIRLLQQKIQSLESRVESVTDEFGPFLRLESNTPLPDSTIPGIETEFVDTISDGDTTRFVVGQDSRRGVYTLDGVAQPTVQLPRGDIIEFDVSGLSDPEKFDIYLNGSTKLVDFDTSGNIYDRSDNIIRVSTLLLSTDYTRLYYRNTEVNGLGWLIVITDN